MKKITLMRWLIMVLLAVATIDFGIFSTEEMVYGIIKEKGEKVCHLCVPSWKVEIFMENGDNIIKYIPERWDAMSPYPQRLEIKKRNMQFAHFIKWKQYYVQRLVISPK